MKEVLIRKGKPADIPEVLRLVKQLAEFERAPLEVETTVEEMELDAFGNEPAFGFLVAERDGVLIGIAIYYVKYSTWKGRCLFLEDIIIEEAFRGKGIGSLLFERVALIAKERKYRRMEWQVLEWNESAIRFYEKYNAVLDSEWVNGKLTYKQLQDFPEK